MFPTKSLEALIESLENVFLDTNLIIFSASGESYLDYFARLPAPFPDTFLANFNYLKKEYIPFLRKLSKINKFFLAEATAMEIERKIEETTKTIRFLENTQKHAKKAAKNFNPILIKNEIHLRDQIISALKSYRKALSKLIANCKDTDRIKLINDSSYDLIFKLLPQDDRAYERDKKIIATALYYSGTANVSTAIITKDKHFCYLIKGFYKKADNLNSSKFKSITTSVYRLYDRTSQGERLTLFWSVDKKELTRSNLKLQH